MRTRYYLLILSMLSSTGYSIPAPNSKIVPIPTANAKQIKNLTSFTQIDVKGRINVSLHTGFRKPQIILKGNALDLAQLKSGVYQDKLFLNLGLGYPAFGEVNVEIRARSLNGFNYEGMGFITGNKLCANALDLTITNPGTTKLAGSIGLRQLKLRGGGLAEISGIHSHYMELHVEGNSKVQLSGEVNLALLDFVGEGGVNLHWVRSDHLKIRGKQAAIIQLGGIVNRLDVELWDHAQFRGRYLRAERTFVKTHDRAVAEISSVCRQSTLASGASDIFYYNLPETRADFMAFNGAVLDMREWDQPLLEDFTIYNKLFP